MLLACMVQLSVAREGYRIQLKMPGVKDSTVYLVHYYGKGLPNIYKRDSARFDKNGTAKFVSTDTTFVGGIYMMLLGDRKTYFEFLLDKGDNIEITANINDLPQDVKFVNSPANIDFQDYIHFLKGFAQSQKQMNDELKNVASKADSNAIRKKYATSSKQLTTYRRDYVQKHPGTLLAAIFSALEVPQVPDGDHYLPDGKTKDTSFAYNYYKAHFWDSFDLQDDRLIHTPAFDAKLDEYINKLTYPWPDSIEKEADMLLRKTRGTKHLFKYTLFWLTRNVENSKVMGMDEVFVYLVENYYMKGDAFWLGSEDLEKYIDRAHRIAPNVIGNLGPEIKLPSVTEKKIESLYDVKARYTVLVFYAPSCGHCQRELPGIDSIYQAYLKKKGVKVFTVSTEGDEKEVTDFIKKYKTEAFINTWDVDHVGDWRGKYDVYSTPSIYLLDERKIIRGKRLDHTNIAGLVDMLDRKEKEKGSK